MSMDSRWILNKDTMQINAVINGQYDGYPDYIKQFPPLLNLQDLFSQGVPMNVIGNSYYRGRTYIQTPSFLYPFLYRAPGHMYTMAQHKNLQLDPFVDLFAKNVNVYVIGKIHFIQIISQQTHNILYLDNIVELLEYTGIRGYLISDKYKKGISSVNNILALKIVNISYDGLILDYGVNIEEESKCMERFKKRMFKNWCDWVTPNGCWIKRRHPVVAMNLSH
jgi:hypothetical protein